jgi:hypothetical protein
MSLMLIRKGADWFWFGADVRLALFAYWVVVQHGLTSRPPARSEQLEASHVLLSLR